MLVNSKSSRFQCLRRCLWIGAVLPAVLGLGTVADRVHASDIIFSIDPNLSSWASSGTDHTYGAFEEQFFGSLAAPVTGHFLVSFDPSSSTPATLQFVGGHGFFEVDDPHFAYPGIGGSLVEAPANAAGRTAGGEVHYAIRDLVWDFTSSPISRSAGVYAGTQSSFIVLSGGAEASFPSGFAAVSYVGASDFLTAGDWVLTESPAGSGNWSLSFDGYYDYGYSAIIGGIPVSGDLRSSFTVVSTAHYGSNNEGTVNPGESTTEALGGSSTTGGVSATFSEPIAGGGTLSVQQVPDTTALTQAALAAAEISPIFVAGTSALSVNPQIWSVDFDGDLAGATVELVFAYDETLLPVGFDETTLGIWHFNSNSSQWDFGGTVDPLANTVTYVTDNFSPFQLGVVPEPSTFVLAAIGLLGLVAFVRRRRKQLAVRWTTEPRRTPMTRQTISLAVLCRKSALALGLICLAAKSAWAVPIVVDPTAGPLQVFDQGGILNEASGFFMGGLEVDPTSGTVWVSQTDGFPGGASTINHLVRSNGLGSAVQVGPNYALGNVANRGNDLTLGPGGLYYIATNSGVYGLDPAAIAPPSLYATNPPGNLTSSGITFRGLDVFVSSDGPGGLFRSPSGGVLSSIIAIPDHDDHVTTPSGRHYLIGDGARAVRDEFGAIVFDLSLDPDTAPQLGGQGNGSRGAIDPVTGDIFMGYSFGGSNQAIFRVRSDFSDAIVFATNFGRNIRDFDFGPSSSGPVGSTSLYVAVNDLTTGLGTIYEIQTHVVPEPSCFVLAAIGLAAFGAWRGRQRKA